MTAAERRKNGPLCQAVHGNTERSPRQGRSRTAIDSASQRFVTVRQVFPDGPAPEGQASSRRFGGGPFPIRRLPGLAGAVLMNAAPLSERSNFEGILSRSRGDVNARVQKIAAQMGLNPVQHRQFRRLHHTSTLLSRRFRRVCREHHTTFSPQRATVLAFSSMICTNLRNFWHFSGNGR